jgi:hypothetical protein
MVGECGALVLANLSVPALSHFYHNATFLSSTAVAATLVGGSLSWIAARIYDQKRQKTFTTRSLAGDLGYFTPAAVFCGFCIYDPVIYQVSHHLLKRGSNAWVAVFAGQLLAFFLFAVALNLYRLSLFKLRGKTL